MTEVQVELGDLRGWSQQVGRASTDAGAEKDYATTHIADADFGKILELMAGDYAGMLPKLHTVLGEDRTRLWSTSAGLNTAATTYKNADEQAAGELSNVGGQQGNVTDDGSAAGGFNDPAQPRSKLVAPSGSVELPEVSFGFIFNEINDLIAWITGFDLREKVTQWLVGDVGKAYRQVDAWRALADATDGVGQNLTSGRQAITATWSGQAATAAFTHMDKWLSALPEQSAAMRAMSQHLSDIIDAAVQMAQVIVDIIKTIIDFLSAALANASIPFYGQWKLVESVWEAVKMCYRAFQVLKVFHDMLVLIIDTIKMCIEGFSVDKLPAAPAAGPA